VNKNFREFMSEKYSSQTDDEDTKEFLELKDLLTKTYWKSLLMDGKDYILDKGPLRSATKCALCKKGAVFLPKEEGLPYYCEDHAPWRE
jgi:hypothetical protein